MSGELNLKQLEEEFNLSDDEQVKKEVATMRDRVARAQEFENPELIIKVNIERANWLLDKIEETIERGGITAGLMASAASLISEITTAANTMALNEFRFDDQDLKHKRIVLQERDIAVKEAIAEAKAEEARGNKIGTVNNNMIFTSRSEVLRLFKEGDSELEGKTIDCDYEENE